MKSTTKRTPQHYIDNEKLLAAIIEYQQSVKVAEATGAPKPRVSNYIGECFIKIATNLSTKSNFVNYTYKDDMLSDGIDNCLVAVEKFDTTKYSNPFAYFTQITFYAFVCRIVREKKQQKIKYKILENMDIDQIVEQSEDNPELHKYLMDTVQRKLDSADPSNRTEPKKRGRKSKKDKEIADLETVETSDPIEVIDNTEVPEDPSFFPNYYGEDEEAE